MAQNVITIEYSDDLLSRLGLTREKFSDEARFLLAAKLYELGRLSSGEAADMTGTSRTDFLMRLPSVGVAISNLTIDDLEHEFALDE